MFEWLVRKWTNCCTKCGRKRQLHGYYSGTWVCPNCDQRKVFRVKDDKIVWMIGEGEPISWEEYCRRMQNR